MCVCVCVWRSTWYKPVQNDTYFWANSSLVYTSGYWDLWNARSKSSSCSPVNVVRLRRCFRFKWKPGSDSVSESSALLGPFGKKKNEKPLYAFFFFFCKKRFPSVFNVVVSLESLSLRFTRTGELFKYRYWTPLPMKRTKEITKKKNHQSISTPRS